MMRLGTPFKVGVLSLATSILLAGFEWGIVAARGQSATASYEAVVLGENTYSMSGPGFGFYPCSLLASGSKVTVVGDREGDWYKIQPPLGSFSWIPVKAIEEKQDGTGTIIVDEIQSRIGSDFSTAHYVYQLTLKKGSIVQLLDRAWLKENGVLEEWFKIAPPTGEARYVAATRLRTPGGATPAMGNFTSIPTAVGPRRAELVPVSATRIPPARSIYPAAAKDVLTTQTGKPADVEIVDDPAATLAERISRMEGQLDLLRTRTPESWNLTAAKKILEDLYASADSDEEKQRALAALERVRYLDRLKDRYERASRQRELAVARDQELELQQKRWEQSLTSLRPPYTAEGILERTGFTVDEEFAWKLTDATGVSSYFVAVPPGLNIDRYSGIRVGMLGTVEQRAGVAVPILRLEQLEPLEFTPGSSTANGQ